MSTEFDAMRSNPDVKELARKLNHMKAEIEKTRSELQNVLRTTNRLELDDTRYTQTRVNQVVSAVGSAVENSLLDEDDMTSDSDTQGATQQSIKAYVDALDTDDIAEGSNLYHTSARAVDAIEAVSDEVIASADKLVFLDNTDGVLKKEALSDLEAILSHDALADFASGEHFTMLDEDDFSSDSDTQAATQQSIKAYVDAFSLIGASNSKFVPCSFAGNNDFANVESQSTYITNNSSLAMFLQWRLSLATSLGSLSLYIKAIRIEIRDSDSNDYIDRVRIWSVDYNSENEADDIDWDSLNGTTVGTFDETFTAHDCSSEQDVVIQIQTSQNNAQALDISAVLLDCYYA